MSTLKKSRERLMLNRTQFWLGLFACGGLIYFVVSVACSISVFEDYSWTRNFLSDLGQDSSPDSARIFNTALVVVGITLIPHGLTLSVVHGIADYWLRASSAMSAIGIIFLGLTPWDTYTLLHNCALVVWLLGLLGTIVSYAVLLRIAGRSSLLGTLLIVAVLSNGFVYALGGTYSLHVIFQKTTIATCFAWYIHLFVLTSTSIIATASIRRIRDDKLATKYIDVLSRRYRK